MAATPAMKRGDSPIAWLSPPRLALLYFLLGLAGVLALVLITPPLQVPDEQQHFARAYELSDLGLRGEVRDGIAGAVLPSSLPEFTERFLGTRDLHAIRPVRALPLRETLQALTVPLDPSRREFVNFSTIALYSPLPYLHLAATIMVGRAAGLGPLGLLYAVRLVNGVVGLAVTAVALSILPVGGLALFVVGLLPMTLFMFASASADATLIPTAFLFTAIAARARFRGRWSRADVVVALIAGLVFCSIKPVYAPLLVIGLPAVFRPGSARHVLAVHALLLAVILSVAIAWLLYSAPLVVSTRENTSVSLQLQGMLADPWSFVRAMGNSLYRYGGDWGRSMIGRLGWWSLQLPRVMYALPMAALGLGLLARRAGEPRIGPLEAAWHVLLCLVSVVLIMLALYLSWTHIGVDQVDGIQGRYFLPLACLGAVTVHALPPRPPRMPVTILSLVVVGLAAVEVVMTPILVARAYQVF